MTTWSRLSCAAFTDEDEDNVKNSALNKYRAATRVNDDHKLTIKIGKGTQPFVG